MERVDDLDTCFLLIGKPRVGKSTAIKRIIHRIGPEYFGGFYTEEVRNSTNRIGFNCVTLSGESERIASVESESFLGTICVDSHPDIDKIKELTGIKFYLMNEENRDLTTEVMVNDIFKLC